MECDSLICESPEIHIGTSGWYYEHWKGTFYPESVSRSGYLGYIATYFDTVEINSTFYHLPKRETFAHWYDIVPADFVFAMKGNRFITHMRKLQDTRSSIEKFCHNSGALQNKRGPVLFQLPPGWQLDLNRMESFLETLPNGQRYAMEFRNETWFSEKVYRLLSENNVACCLYNLDGKTSPLEMTADFVYVRLHGPDGPYQGSYDDGVLKEWALKFYVWRREGKDVYCYFNNDQYGYAVHNALNMKRFIEELRC